MNLLFLPWMLCVRLNKIDQIIFYFNTAQPQNMFPVQMYRCRKYYWRGEHCHPIYWSPKRVNRSMDSAFLVDLSFYYWVIWLNVKMKLCNHALSSLWSSLSSLDVGRPPNLSFKNSAIRSMFAQFLRYSD